MEADDAAGRPFHILATVACNHSRPESKPALSVIRSVCTESELKASGLISMFQPLLSYDTDSYTLSGTHLCAA
jgi:hypothetical protein